MKNSFLLLSRLRSVLFALVLMLGCSFAFAQTKTISGTVTADGLPLPGVEVKVKGGNGGAVTDFDGLYKIDANVGDVLVFSSLGFLTQSVTVASDAKIDITLVTDVKVLEETVVIGYGERKLEDVVGSVVSVKAEDIEKVNAVSFEQALVAKAPGVRVVQSQGGPGAGLRIQVRGSTSFLASADPLYVIDGFPIDTGSDNNVNISAGNNSIGTDVTSPLANIDPASIASIEVLKDAAATAVYGARGANGVVLITTKKGKSKKATISFDSSIGISRITKQIDILNPAEFADLAGEFNPVVQGGDGAFNRPFALLYFDDQGNPLPLGGVDGLKVSDFRGLLFQDAFFQKHRLAISGRADKSNYSGSLSWTDQDGIIRTSNFKRLAANFNLRSSINDKLTATISFNGGLTTRDGVVTASSGEANGNSTARSGVITSISRSTPIQPDPDRIRDEDGNPVAVLDEEGFIQELRGRQLVNPIAIVERSERPSTQMNSILNTALEYKIIEGMKIKSTLGGSFYSSNSRAVFPADFGFGRFGSANGRVFESNFLSTSFINENTLNYIFNLGGGHNFNTLVGFTQQRGTSKNTGFQTKNVFDESFVPDNLRLAIADVVTSGASNSGVLSYLARISYNYSSKYYIDLVGRRDGSIRFRPGNRWGNFGSVGLRWNASKESFMESLKGTLDDLTLKASFGTTGNQRIAPFVSQVKEGVDPGSERGAIVQLDNPDLTWETTEQTDLGLGFALFDKRIRVQADAYRKRTKDLLYALRTPASRGFVTQIAGRNTPGVVTNAGSIQNQGLELSLGANIIDLENFTWSLDANITFNENEILDLAGNPEIIFTSNGSNQVVQDFVLEEGGSLGAYYGFETDGLYRYSDFVEFDGLSEIEAARIYRAGGEGLSDQERKGTNGDSPSSGFTLKPGIARLENRRHRPGQRKYKDIDGDGIVTVDGDRKIIGSFQPDHFGGFTNSFRYKNFDLSATFNWSYGNEVLNHNLATGQSPNSFRNGFGLTRDRWRPFNRDTNQPSLRGVFPLSPGPGQPAQADSSLVEDGSFLRFTNLSLGYKMPKSLTEKLLLSNLKIYGSVDNIYVWSNYSGYDPDVSIGGDAATPGIDFDAFPRARTFRIGIKGSF